MLTEIRETFAAYLRDLDYFTSPTQIPVFTEKLKTLENDLQKGLSNFGISALVMTATGKHAQNQVPRQLRFEDVKVLVSAIESPKVNIKSGVSASDLAEAIAWYGKGFSPLGDAGLLFEGIELGEHPTQLVYHVIFKLEGAIQSAPTRPTIQP